MDHIEEIKNVLNELIHPEKSYRFALYDTEMLQKLAKILNKLNSEEDK